MQITVSGIGCGAGAICGLYGFAHNQDAIGNALFEALRLTNGRNDYSILFFGDGVRERNGEVFSKWITEAKLGEVQASHIVRSPLHKEREHQGYQMWLWYVDHDALKDWYKSRVDAEKQKAMEKEAEVAASLKPPAAKPRKQAEYYRIHF